MLWLTDVRDGDRGAIAMIIAMLFGFGVMIGLAALTIDVGNINADRRQLQNGADAVALAFAQQCATNATCDPQASGSSLVDLADKNAADGFTSISRVDGALGTPLAGKLAICGDAANATNLLPCPTTWVQSMTNLQECPSAPPSGANYVRVYTQTTLNAARDHILPYSFGAAIVGAGSGANQQACATVSWGTVGSVDAFPFTFSACEWSWATSGSGVYPPASPPVYPPGPPYDSGNPAQASWQRVIELNDTKSALDCPSWQGHDLPGGFGWVDQISCAATISNDAWVAVDPGMGKGTANCKTEIAGTVGHTILIPVYDCIDDTSLQRTPCVVPTPKVTPSNARYHITGFATFYVSGMDITGGLKIDPPFKQKCDSKCIYGWFLKDLLPVADVLGDSEDFGTVVIKLVG